MGASHEISVQRTEVALIDGLIDGFVVVGICHTSIIYRWSQHVSTAAASNQSRADMK